MDKLDELAREAAGAIRDMNPVPSNEERLLPYLRRAYEMGVAELKLSRNIFCPVCGGYRAELHHEQYAEMRGGKSRPVEPVEKARSEKFSIGDRVTIRDGALVGQDMKQIRWKNTDKIFTIVDKVYNEMRYKLIADGYGEPDSYGNGCLYSNAPDIALFKSFEFEKPHHDDKDYIDMACNCYTCKLHRGELAAKDAELAALKEENEKLKDKLNNVQGDITNIWNNFIRRLESGGV